MEGQKVTKTYWQIPVSDLPQKACKAEVVYRDVEGLAEADTCGRKVEFAFEIDTLTIFGLRRVSKVGFCRRHVPRRYREWFALGRLEQH